MKKRGSALVSVLIACTVLIILSTAVSVGVMNTTKLNKRYSDDIDLELAAKSGLNIFKEELLSDIESVRNSSDLPNALEESDSGINSFDNITILKEIQKDNIENEGTITGYKYTVISTAKYKSIENSMSKTVSQVINVNLKKGESNGDNNEDNDEDESDIGNIIIEPVNFINIKNTIEISNSSQNNEELIKQISVGGEVILKGQKVDVEKNDSLKNLNLSLNASAIEDSININVDTSIPFDINSIAQKDDINRIKNTTSLDIQNETVKFEGNIDIAHDLVINLKDSVVFIDGFLNGYSNSNITLNLENSILVISGGIYTSDELNINMSNNGSLYTKNISSGKDLNIEMNSGKIIVTNGVIESRSETIQINLENESVIYSSDKIFGKQGIYGTMSNSIVDVNEVDSNNGSIVLNIENESVFYCKKQLKGSKEVSIDIDNSKLIIEESDMRCTSGKLSLNIKNKSNVFVGKTVYSPVKININLNNSNIILGFKSQYLSEEILANGEIQLNSLNGTYIINGSISASGGIKSELTNSAIICIGRLNLYGGLSKIVNLDKSYVLILGNLDKAYIANLELQSNSKSFTPDNKNVINTINKYLQ